MLVRLVPVLEDTVASCIGEGATIKRTEEAANSVHQPMVRLEVQKFLCGKVLTTAVPIVIV